MRTSCATCRNGFARASSSIVSSSLRVSTAPRRPSSDCSRAPISASNWFGSDRTKREPVPLKTLVARLEPKSQRWSLELLFVMAPHVANAHAGYMLKRSPDEQSDIPDLRHPHVAGAHAGYTPNRSPDEQSDIRDLRHRPELICERSQRPAARTDAHCGRAASSIRCT